MSVEPRRVWRGKILWPRRIVAAVQQVDACGAQASVYGWVGVSVYACACRESVRVRVRVRYTPSCLWLAASVFLRHREQPASAPCVNGHS